MASRYWRPADRLGRLWTRTVVGGFGVAKGGPKTPRAISARWKRRLDTELMLAAVSGPLGTAIGPVALLSILYGWTADLGRAYGWDPATESHRRVLRDVLGRALWQRWKGFRGNRPGVGQMGLKAVRALLLGQDAAWVGRVMERVEDELRRSPAPGRDDAT